MFVLDEKEKDYRFGDSGPKYLMKGPRSNFAVVRFNPGQDFPAHYHEIMEISMFLKGKLIFMLMMQKSLYLKESLFILNQMKFIM